MSYMVLRRKAATKEESFAGSSGWVRSPSDAVIFQEFWMASAFILIHVKTYVSCGFTMEIVEV